MQFITEAKEINTAGKSILYFYTPELFQHKKILSLLDSIPNPHIKIYAIDFNYFPNLKIKGANQLPTVIYRAYNKNQIVLAGLQCTLEFEKLLTVSGD